MLLDVMVLAGSTNNGKLRGISDAASEAMITIGDRIMVDYVVAALRASRQTGRIAIIGPVADLKPLYGGMDGMILIEAGNTAMQSVANGISGLKPEGKVLVVTGDIPLISPTAIDDFLALCGDRTADLYYPVVSREASEGKFPQVKRTYVRLKDGTFTGGNLFLVDPLIIPRVMQKAEDLVKLRKSPVALARAIGLPVIVKLLLHLLTLREAERRVSMMMGIRGAVVVSQFPEVGIDVDKPSDLELVRSVLVS